MSAMAFQITSFTIVYPTVYSGTDHQTKNQSSASLAFVRGIHRWPVNSPHKGPVTRKMFPLDDGIMEYGRTLEELEVLPQQSKAQQNRCIFHGTYPIPRDLVRLDRSMWHITVVICTGEHWFLLTQLKPESTNFVVTGLGAIWRCARRLTNGSAQSLVKRLATASDINTCSNTGPWSHRRVVITISVATNDDKVGILTTLGISLNQHSASQAKDSERRCWFEPAIGLQFGHAFQFRLCGWSYVLCIYQWRWPIRSWSNCLWSWVHNSGDDWVQTNSTWWEVSIDSNNCLSNRWQATTWIITSFPTPLGLSELNGMTHEPTYKRFSFCNFNSLRTADEYIRHLTMSPLVRVITRCLYVYHPSQCWLIIDSIHKLRKQWYPQTMTFESKFPP